MIKKIAPSIMISAPSELRSQFCSDKLIEKKLIKLFLQLPLTHSANNRWLIIFVCLFVCLFGRLERQKTHLTWSRFESTSAHWSVLRFGKISLTNGIFSPFWTRFLLPLLPAKINFELDFCRIKIQFFELDFPTWFLKNQVQINRRNEWLRVFDQNPQNYIKKPLVMCCI